MRTTKKTKRAKFARKKSAKRTRPPKGIAVVGVDKSAEKFYLAYPRIEIHRNALQEQWYRYLSGYSQHDLPFTSARESFDAKQIRGLFVSFCSDCDSNEFATVPIFDLRREQATFAH